MSIQVSGISKQFGDFKALHDVSLDFNSGELVALLGPSGCGKTTLLRIIAGLEHADSGTVMLDGRDTSNIHVRNRNVGFVFQHYALFKHMTVFDNLAFGLRMKPRALRPSNAVIEEKVHRLLKLVQLDWLADRFPSQLSGGQRQRIALARALAVEPKVLLLDEPFGALDAKVRKELRRWLRRLHDELHITSIFVTHDQDEALEVADRVVLMNQGRVEQIGTPEDVYLHPATPFVYGFLGAVNSFNGRTVGEGIHVGECNLVHEHTVLKRDAHLVDGAEVLAFARPHEIEIHVASDCTTGIPAKVARVLRFGLGARVELDSVGLSPAQHFEVEISTTTATDMNLQEGQLVRLSAKALNVFERKQQEKQKGLTV